MERESPSDTLLSDFHHPDSHPSIGSGLIVRFNESLILLAVILEGQTAKKKRFP
jgi:hypothetical protein